MNNEVIDLLIYIAYAFILAIALTWILNIFEQFFEMVKICNKVIFLMVKDFISIIAYTLLLILILYYINHGAFRGIYIVAILLGIYFYYTILSKTLCKISMLFLIPVVCFLKIIIKFVKKLVGFLFIAIEKFYLRLYNIIKKSKIYFYL